MLDIQTQILIKNLNLGPLNHNLMYSYAHTPLDEETIKLTGFSSGDKLYAFFRGFYGLKGLPIFFSQNKSQLSFDHLETNVLR